MPASLDGNGFHDVARDIAIEEFACPALTSRKVGASEGCCPRPFSRCSRQRRANMQDEGELQDRKGEGEQQGGDQCELHRGVAAIVGAQTADDPHDRHGADTEEIARSRTEVS